MNKYSAHDIETIHNSDLFDSSWYLEQYSDVKMLGMDPAEHYLWIGAKLDRNPSKRFDATDYLIQNIDVAFSEVNPLLHFLRWGKHEGRTFVPLITQSTPLILPVRTTDTRPIIVYESHNLKIQGAPKSLYEIAAGIKDRKTFVPFMTSTSTGPLVDFYRKKALYFSIHGISPGKLTDIDSLEYFTDMLSEYYININASIVHVNTLQNFYCVYAAYKADIPVIWNIRESENPESYYDYLSDGVRKFAFSCFGYSNSVIFVSNATQDLWRKHLDGIVDHVVIPNGIRTDSLMALVYGTNRSAIRESLGIKQDDVLLLNVGTVSERKGQSDLVSAVSLIDGRMKKNIVLAIIGFNSSNYSKQLRDTLGLMKADGFRILEIGESQTPEDVKMVAELYLASDIFVLTSRIESYPRVTLEAMSFGLAVISTPCFGVKDQLEDGVSGLFYEEGDIQKLYSHIENLSRDKNERRRYGGAAFSRLSQLNSYDQMLDMYENVYLRILRRGKLVSTVYSPLNGGEKGG